MWLRMFRWLHQTKNVVTYFQENWNSNALIIGYSLMEKCIYIFKWAQLFKQFVQECFFGYSPTKNVATFSQIKKNSIQTVCALP